MSSLIGFTGCLSEDSVEQRRFVCLDDADCVGGDRCVPIVGVSYGECGELLVNDVSNSQIISTGDVMIEDSVAFDMVDMSCSCGPTEACIQGSCVAGRRVFVSSTTSSAAFGDLSAADAVCQSLADAAGLGSTWLAWLSDASDAPARSASSRRAVFFWSPMPLWRAK